jgi:hypothetical protein
MWAAAQCVLSRLVLGIVVGVALGPLFWWGSLVSDGKSIGEAMKGEVDDAASSLQALALVGSLVGAAVGLATGFLMASGQQGTPKDTRNETPR